MHEALNLTSAAKFPISTFFLQSTRISFTPEHPKNYHKQHIRHNPSLRRWHSKLLTSNKQERELWRDQLHWGHENAIIRRNWTTLRGTRRKSTNSAYLENLGNHPLCFLIRHRLSIIRILPSSDIKPKATPNAKLRKAIISLHSKLMC